MYCKNNDLFDLTKTAAFLNLLFALKFFYGFSKAFGARSPEIKLLYSIILKSEKQ